MFSKDELQLFSEECKSPFSTIVQGKLGHCYYIATLVALDSRRGALENLFVTNEVNEAGAYGMRLWMNGKRVVVHVDDWLPAREYTTATSYGAPLPYNEEGTWPAFAYSTVKGELWPMIAEKVWAKLEGSYERIAGGDPQQVL